MSDLAQIQLGRCLGCGRPVKPHLGQFIYHRPDGSAWWLHRKVTCTQLYEDQGAAWNRPRAPKPVEAA